jgi:sec-independent protein translocase protein TatC
MNFRQPNEDLFESSRMTFGQHLEELRGTLVKCVIAIALGCVIGFSFASQTVEYLKGPLVEAMADFNATQAADDIIEREGYVAPELLPWLEEEKLTPRRMRVDPGELVRSLQAVIPDFGAKVNLNPYGFRVSHFDQARLPQLCERLINRDTEPQSIAARLTEVWSPLDESERLTITRVAELAKENQPASDADVLAVAKTFDRLSSANDLSRADCFAQLFSDAPASAMDWLEPKKANPLARMKQSLGEDFDAAANQRLNRAVLFGLFAGQMPELKTDLVTIQMWESAEFEPQSLTVTEPFMIWMKAGLFSGIILALPAVMYFLWSFVAAGLYPHEQKYVHIFLPISLTLFVCGVALAFFFVFEPVLGFLFSFNRQMGIAPQMRINDWLSFVMFLPLGFGVAFQLPLVMLFMNRINLFSVQDYLDKWRIAVMCIFVLSMILTPAN